MAPPRTTTSAAAQLRLDKNHIINLRSKEVIADGLRVWVGGESGSGKSTAAMSLMSQAALQGVQILVLDAHAEYGNLWEAAPGRIARFGYGSEPIGQHSVEMCVELLREGKSLLLDLSHWTDLYPMECDTFVLNLMRGLYELRRREPQQMLVLIEEAQSFAPQQQTKGQTENVRLFTAVATGGRKFGINFLLASQRQSLVDSNVIAACNVRLFLRVSEQKDWKKMKTYVPPGLKLTFGTDTATDIKKFKSGEALLVSRWFKAARIRLDLPQLGLVDRLAQLGA